MVSFKIDSKAMFVIIFLLHSTVVYAPITPETVAEMYRSHCREQILRYFNPSQGEIAELALRLYHRNMGMDMITEAYYHSMKNFLNAGSILNHYQFCEGQIAPMDCRLDLVNFFSVNPLQSLIRGFYEYNTEYLQNSSSFVKNYWQTILVNFEFDYDNFPNPARYCELLYPVMNTASTAGSSTG